MTDVPKTSRITDVAMPGKPASFGELLRQYRVAAGLSREALAERAGVSARGIQDLERGINRTPRADTVALLIRALALSPEEQGALEATISRSRRPSISAAVMIGSEHDQRPASAPPEPALVRGRFLGALPPFPLAGRTDEWQRLQVLIARVEQRDGQVVALAGEPGVGKTRLAQEITVELRNRAFLVAAGRCYEPQQGIPYYPFLDVVASAYHGASAALRAEVLRRWPAVTRFLPDSLPEDGIPRTANQEGQSRLFLAVTAFLQALTHEQPVGLLLDDVHWADGASLALLAHLARHGRSSRLLLAVTYRDTELSGTQPLGRILHDLQREQLIERIHLRPLDQDGTTALIASVLDGATVPGEFVSLLHRRTNGNAFFLQETLQALRERGELSQDDGRWHRPGREEIPIPESVRSVIRERLLRMSEETQDLLRAASVLGQTFGFDELEGMSGWAEREVEAWLEEALAAGLVEELEGNQYSFNHALTQGTLYAELSGRRRRRLHLAAGAALEVLPGRRPQGRAAELAWHFLEGDDRERAFDYSLRAMKDADQVEAYGEVEGHARTALALALELEDRNRALEAEGWIAWAVYTHGRYDDALAHAERGMMAVETAESRALLPLMLEVAGRACTSLGDLQRGRTYLERAVRVAAEVGDASRRGMALTGLALVLHYLGEWDAARHSLDLATETAHTLGPVSEGFLLLDQARLSILEGDWAGALRQLEDLIRRAEQTNPGLYAEWLLARVGVLEGRARVTLERMEALRRAPDFPRDSLAEVLPILAEAYLAAGDGVQALQTAALAVRQAREQKHRPALVDALVVHGTVLGRQETWAEAMQALNEAITLAREMGYAHAEGRALRERGLIGQRRGQSEQARVDLEAARIIFERLGARRDLEHAEQAISTLPG